MTPKLKKINLFIPGAAKSGTSSLHEMLKLHPEINMSTDKEPHFFSAHKGELESKENIAAYLQNFDFSKEFRYWGESSTGYFYFEEFKRNFKVFANPDAKFILILRNPIDRTYSHYNYLKSLGSEDLDFKSAVLRNHQEKPSPTDVLPELMMNNYYQYSLYGKWLSLFFESFKNENIKIILFENLKSQPLQTLNSCFDFLGLSKINKIHDIDSNKTVKIYFPKLYKSIRIFAFNKSKSRDVVKHLLPKNFRRKHKKRITELLLNLLKTKKSLPTANDEERQWLYDLFKADVQQLKKVTGLPLDEWKEFRNT